jgi:Tfp pilus assembly protein PilO
VDQVVRQVSDQAIQYRQEAPKIQSDNPVTAAMYMEQPLKVKLAGNFNGFYEFLAKLQQLPRITRIPDMKITRATDADGHMKAEFTLSIYFQQEADAK